MKFLISIAFSLLFYLASASGPAGGKRCGAAKLAGPGRSMTQLSAATLLKDVQAENIHPGSGPLSPRTLRDQRMTGIALGNPPSDLPPVERLITLTAKGRVRFGTSISLLLLFPEHNFW